MNQKRLFVCFCVTILLGILSVNTYASGKQIRPPKMDVCDIDPENENCSLETKANEKEDE